jgi:hypothetical protein
MGRGCSELRRLTAKRDREAEEREARRDCDRPLEKRERRGALQTYISPQSAATV